MQQNKCFWYATACAFQEMVDRHIEFGINLWAEFSPLENLFSPDENLPFSSHSGVAFVGVRSGANGACIMQFRVRLWVSRVTMFFARKSALVSATVLLFCAGMFLALGAQAQDDLEDDFKPAASPGGIVFESRCAGCHGLDGRGGEHAPNIASNARVQHLSNTQIAGIVSNGISGTSMPAFRTLTPVQLRELISYLRVLQGSSDLRKISGDPAQGRELFFGKADCSSCHTMSGEGGFLGPDLSTYGSALSADAILKAILNPKRIVPPGYRSATVTTGDNRRVEGVVRNEDNFSVQLQSKDGSFHFFQKSDLQSFEYASQSLMPTNYGDRLSRDELNDLAGYLMSAAPVVKAERAAKEHQ
jgi:cytochrome c oxidase cbb3-type subunit 3